MISVSGFRIFPPHTTVYTPELSSVLDSLNTASYLKAESDVDDTLNSHSKNKTNILLRRLLHEAPGAEALLRHARHYHERPLARHAAGNSSVTPEFVGRGGVGPSGSAADPKTA